MQNIFNFKAIEKAGRSKGARDLKKCQKSGLGLTLAIAIKLEEYQNFIPRVIGHRLAHKESIFSAKEEDQKLFEEILKVNLSAQYIAIFAFISGLNLEATINTVSFENFKKCLHLNIDSDELSRRVDRGNGGIPSGNFSNMMARRMDFYTKSLYGRPSEDIEDLFKTYFNKDADHINLRKDIETMFQRSAKENLKQFKPS